MIALTLEEIAHAVSGELVLGDSGVTEKSVITGLTDTDSRQINPGDIFVAKPGDMTDGHLFVGAAVSNGAALVRAGLESAGRWPLRPHR